jgi:VanZ family protein
MRTRRSDPDEIEYNTRMDKIHAFARRWGPSILMMALIFFFSSIPSKELPSIPGVDTLFKKGGHMLGYGLLALSFGHALGWERKRWWQLPLFLVFLYACSDEFHQRLVAGRHSSVIDVAIDLIGAGLALLLWHLYQTRNLEKDTRV